MAILRFRLTLALALLFLPQLLPAQEASPTETLQGWIAEMEAFYESHPEMKDERGSGWKPFNRAKWFYEPRLEDGRLPDPATRWALSEARIERERSDAYAPLRGWFSAGPTGLSGRILDIAFHPTNPDILYVASASGGLWKSEDGGLSYATTTDQLPVLEVGAVAVLPWNPDIVLLGSGEGNGAGVWGLGMLRSTDAGQTWQETNLDYTVGNGHGFNAIAVNPTTHTILAAARDGLWRSTNDGAFWFRIEDGLWYDVAWKTNDPTQVYAVKGFTYGEDGGVMVSHNDGISFVLAGTGQPAATLIGNSRLGLTASDPDVVYVHYVNRSTSGTLGVYRSEDAGETWTVRNNSLNMCGGQGWYNVTLAVDPDDSDVLIAGGVHLYRSVDGGVNFYECDGEWGLGNETDVHVDHHAAVYQPGFNDVLWVGSDGGVWRSEDDGETWQSRLAGLVTYQFYDIAVAQTDPIFMMGGTQDNGVPGRTGGDTWFGSTLYADGMITNISPTNHNFVWSEWQFGNHVRSTNGGQSWFNIMTGITGNGAWVAPVAQDQSAPYTLFTSTSDGIFKTTSAGNLWNHVDGHVANWIDISPANSDIVWTLGSNLIRRSTDGGASWSPAGSFGFSYQLPSRVYAHPVEENTVFVTFRSYRDDRAHLGMSTDLGATWTDVSGDLPAQPVHCMVVDPLRPSDWFVGTEAGVWHSGDGGASWLPHEEGFPHVVVTDLEINGWGRKLVAGTYGRGAWEINLSEPTALADFPSSPASRNLMLDAPYPNPVGDRTTLRFAARGGRPASLMIYDPSGRLVERVADVRGDGLIRTVDWRSGELASGVYMAVLSAGEERVSRKLIISR